MTAEPHSSHTLANMAMVARVVVMGLNIQAASVVILCEPRFKSPIENQTASYAYLPFLAVSP